MYGKQKGSKALPGGTEKANKGGARKRSIDAKLKPKVWRKFVLGRIVVWPEVNRRQQFPMKRVRPSTKEENTESKLKRLEMENELLRNFLQELERK